MTRYRKKPVEVEAWQVGSDEPMPDWIHEVLPAPRHGYGAVVVMTFARPLYAFDGVWIVSSDETAWRMFPPDFEKQYEVAE